jgi:hypothetical protein
MLPWDDDIIYDLYEHAIVMSNDVHSCLDRCLGYNIVNLRLYIHGYTCTPLIPGIECRIIYVNVKHIGSVSAYLWRNYCQFNIAGKLSAKRYLFM